MVYRIGPSAGRRAAGDALADILRAAAVRHPHLLAIRRAAAAEDGDLILVAEFPGSHRGLISLAELGAQKAGGVFDPAEAWLAAGHTLRACEHAHAAGLAHGGICADEILVDPRGRVLLELFGVGRVLAVEPQPLEGARRADLRSIAAMVYEMLTGLPLGGSRMPIVRAVGRGARAWDAWIDRGLGDGFETAAAALVALSVR